MRFLTAASLTILTLASANVHADDSSDEFGMSASEIDSASLSTLPPVINPAVGLVTFGPNVTQSVPFDATVTAIDPNGGGNVLMLAAAAPVPNGLTNLAVSPSSSSTTPTNFQVWGIVAYQPFGSTIVLPLTASNGVTSSNGSLTLTIIPEPSSLALTSAAIGLRR